MTRPLTRAEKAQLLRDIGAERILVKDGPYGTAIQNYRLDEAGFRAGRDFAQDQKGNNDLLNVTRPDVVSAARAQTDRQGPSRALENLDIRGRLRCDRVEAPCLFDGPIKIEGADDHRRATLVATGEAVQIGPIEKMSKSKRNTVDPDDIISSYGADVARWFMLSDSPPDRDVNWTERGVQGAWRFAQRLWRLIGDCTEIAASAPAERPQAFGRTALDVRRAAHKALARVSDEIEKLHFNVCVAQIYELTNALSEAVNNAKQTNVTADLQWAIREAAEILVALFHPMMPHLAEECYAALGHDALIAQQAWPELEPDLLVEDTVTLPVQVNGRKRADVTVARDAGNQDIEAAVLALPPVQRALEGKTPKRVIVVPSQEVAGRAG